MSRFHVKFWAIAVSFVYMAVFWPVTGAGVVGVEGNCPLDGKDGDDTEL